MEGFDRYSLVIRLSVRKSWTLFYDILSLNTLKKIGLNCNQIPVRVVVGCVAYYFHVSNKREKK